MRPEIIHWLQQGTLKDNPLGKLDREPDFPGAAEAIRRLAEQGLIDRWHSGHTLRGDRRIEYRISKLGRERLAEELRKIDDAREPIR